MYKKRKKHGYAERLKYMHMLENGYTIGYINRNFGIDHDLLGQLWVRYQSKGPSGLLKKQIIKANYALKVQVLRDIEENHITLVAASLKYNMSASQIRVWRKIARTYGYEALSITRSRDRPPKNDMGRPRKKKPEEMTEQAQASSDDEDSHRESQPGGKPVPHSEECPSGTRSHIVQPDCIRRNGYGKRDSSTAPGRSGTAGRPEPGTPDAQGIDILA